MQKSSAEKRQASDYILRENLRAVLQASFPPEIIFDSREVFTADYLTSWPSIVALIEFWQLKDHLELGPQLALLLSVSMRKLLINDFFLGNLPFQSLTDVIAFFEVIIGEHQSYTVPYQNDPEYPSIYGKQVAARLKTFIERFPDWQKLTDERLMIELTNVGIPISISLVLVNRYRSPLQTR